MIIVESDEYSTSDNDDYDGGMSDDELDEIVNAERRRDEEARCLANPDLTTAQLRELFPELSDHWRWAQSTSTTIKCGRGCCCLMSKI